MFRDVWKKIGLKVFLVVCSVLLLGGVAIAVPRLRATEASPAGGTSNDAQATSGSALGSNSAKQPVEEENEPPEEKDAVDATSAGEKTASARAIEDDDEIHVWGGLDSMGQPILDKLEYNEGGKVEPKELVVVNADDEIEEHIYNFDITKSYDKAEVGEKLTITVKINGKEHPVTYEIVKKTIDFSKIDVEMTVTKADKELVGNVSDKPWIVSSLNDTFSDPSKLTVKYTVSDNDIKTLEYGEGKDYKIVDNKANALGVNNDIGIELSKYRDSNNNSIVYFRPTVFKRMNTDHIQISGTNLKDLKVIDDEISGSDQVLSSRCYTPKRGKPYYLIVGNPNAYYVDTKITEILAPEIDFDLSFEGVDYNEVFDYDEIDEGKENVDSGICRYPTNVKIGGTRLNPDTDYQAIGPSSFDITNPVDQTATAGEVRMTINGTGDTYGGSISTTYYYVQRSLVGTGQKQNTNLEISYNASDFDDAANKIINYDGEDHKILPVLRFKESGDSGYKLSQGAGQNRDYQITYTLIKEDGTATNINNVSYNSNTVIKDAGTVYMSIKGNATKGAKNNEGHYYYGDLTGTFEYDVLSYKIGRRSVKDGYTLVFQGDNIFDRKGVNTKSEILRKLYLQHTTDGVTSKVKVGDPDDGALYVDSFYKDAACSIPIEDKEWRQNSLTSGTYYVKLDFTKAGNYKDSLTAAFQIREYELSDIWGINWISCDQGCEKKENVIRHYYTGSEHKPEFELLDTNRNAIPTSAYTSKWDSNTYPGETSDSAELEITLTEGDYGKKSYFFTIYRHPLQGYTITPTTKDFSDDSHAYIGWKKNPVDILETVQLERSEDDVLTLTKGTDSDFTVEGLYYKDGNNDDQRVTPGKNVEYTNGEYYYIIKGVNNYVNAYDATDSEDDTVVIRTKPFRFKTKSIADKEIDIDLSKVDTSYVGNDQTSDLEKYEKKLEAIIITDNTISDEGKILRQGTDKDYIIKEVNIEPLKTGGYITFKIEGQGCYTGTSEDYKLYIGTNICDPDTEFSYKSEKCNVKSVTVGDNATEWEAKFSSSIFSSELSEANFKANATSKISVSHVKDLVCGTDYKVKSHSIEYKDDKQYGRFEIVGINGYYGTVYLKYEIRRIPLDEGDYQLKLKDGLKFVYDGLYQEPGMDDKTDLIIMKKQNGSWVDTSTLGEDEQVTYKIYYEKNNPQDGLHDKGYGYTNNLNATVKSSSKAKVWITGTEKYKGVLSAEFEIEQRPLEDATNNPGVIDQSYFKLVWPTDNNVADFPYTSYTYDAEQDKILPGVRPNVTLKFRPGGTDDETKWVTLGKGSNKDYSCQYENNYMACPPSGASDANSPKVHIIANDQIGNFTGNVYEKFNIHQVSLSESNKDNCEITISGGKDRDIYPFTGNEQGPAKPDGVSIKLKGQDGSWYTLDYEVKDENGQVVVKDGKPVHNFEIERQNATFISHDAATALKITGTVNCNGERSIPYTICGKLNEDTEHSKVVIADNQKIDYAKPFNKEQIRAEYWEKLSTADDYSDDGTHGKKHDLITLGGGKACEVTVDNNVIGTGRTITLTSNCAYLEGSRSATVTIVGNLDRGTPETEVIGSNIVPYDAGDDFKLQNLITVKCGGKTLEYGKEYKFKDPQPKANKLGTNTAYIVPAGEATTYLKGEYDFEYEVKTELGDGIELRRNDQPFPTEFDYAHGEPVFDLATVDVYLNGAPLLKTQYEISLADDNNIDVGEHTITVKGIGTYTGTKNVVYTIKAYNLGDHAKDINVSYNDKVEYTGDTVHPKVESVTVTKPSGDPKVLSLGDETNAAEYEIISGNNEDHVNWTKDKAHKPSIYIHGVGKNYTGNLECFYSITRKDIADEDVKFTEITPQDYRNGKDIKPIPEAFYHENRLSGLEYSGNPDDYNEQTWTDYTKHFTYAYEKEKLNEVGSKKIRIQGIGNFKGERTLPYEVVALDLAKTELTFTSDAPVYDGEAQTPAFKLYYDGEEILEWSGKEAISKYIRNPKVEFTSNVDATKEDQKALVTISPGNTDNYTGTRKATFTILPASLENSAMFKYRPINEMGTVDLRAYKLELEFLGVGKTVKPKLVDTDRELEEGELGIYFDNALKANHGDFLAINKDYKIEFKYVEPDSDDVDIREEYQDKDISYAGKVMVTITGDNNYTDSARFWYYIGKDISSLGDIRLQNTTALYNSRNQPPVAIVSGLKESDYTISYYKNEAVLENLISVGKDFVNAGTYYVRIEGAPKNGTYATKPTTLTYTITPREISNDVVIDGFKREYFYTGSPICPIGISVMDYIDKTKYRLTENLDYTLSYTNNVNVGVASINVEGVNNFTGSASAKFNITSSVISSGGNNANNSFTNGTGEISGSVPVAPDDVKLTMDTADAMYYTGNAVMPKVSIAGMTENVDYVVSYSNNVEVGTGTVAITGVNNNSGMVTKNFRIIAQLSKCTIAPIPDQQHTGSAVTPPLTVTCGNKVLVEGADYVASYANNINIGTATVTIRAAGNANFTGSATATFSIGNNIGSFLVSGHAGNYTYTGSSITPGVTVESGSEALKEGTDYKVSYDNNVNVGVATITVTGMGKYSGTQTTSFAIQPKNIATCSTSEVSDKTYTGDAYTPNVTVSDGSRVLQNGVDYTLTYSNNVEPGTASIIIKSLNSNYTGTKVVNFEISAVAVKGLKASEVTYKSLKLSWTAQSYADGYQVCDSKSKVVKNVKGNSTTIKGLSPIKTYKYKVRSYVTNESGTKSYSAFSSVVSVTTKLKTPTVKVTSKKKGRATIKWSKISGATGYEVYYKKSDKAKYKKIKTIKKADVCTLNVKGLKSKSRAYFRVRAYKNSGSKKIYSKLNTLKVITVK